MEVEVFYDMQQVTNMQEIKTIVNKNEEMIICKNSNNNIIIMSMEEYKKNIFDNKTIEKLLESEKDIEEGKTKKATEVIKELKAKYGF